MCYTEAVIVAALLKRGYEVFKPVAAHSRCDFVAVIEGDFKRVQCKTARLRDGIVRFNAYSQCGSLRGASRRHYWDVADYFLAYCEDNDTIYMVPVAVAPTCECYLRIEPPKNNQIKNVMWAKDFELTKPGAGNSSLASPVPPYGEVA